MAQQRRGGKNNSPHFLRKCPQAGHGHIGGQDDEGWTTLVYDAIDRLTQETRPDSVVVSHTHDDIGRRIEVRALSNSTYYTYDEANRMTEAKAEKATAGAASYAYV